jgi:hypothetical protein
VSKEKEHISVAVRLGNKEAEWISEVAKHAMVSPDVAASVIFAMSVVRIKRTSDALPEPPEVKP